MSSSTASSPHAEPPVTITGAHGWLGRCLVAYFREHGWQTRGLVRSPIDPANERAFRLGEDVAPETLAGAQALIHCAYDFSPRTWPELERLNVAGTERLFRAAQAAGVSKLVYISTMSAFPAARSLYGKAKLAAERIAAQYGAFIVRPGLITGENAGGMFGALQKQVAAAKILPVIAGDANLYAVHQRDLCEVIYRYCTGEFGAPPKPLTAAHPQPWPFRKLLAELAARAGRKPTFLPLPWQAVWLGLKTAETLGLKLNFRSDSVVSLANQDPAPDFSVAQATRFHPRPL